MEYLAKKPFLVMLTLTLVFIAILDLVFKVDNSFVRSGLAAGLAVVLSPRKKKIKERRRKISETGRFK